MRVEIFLLLLLVGFSVSASSYYARRDGWYSDAPDEEGVGNGYDLYGVNRHDKEKQHNNLWGWNSGNVKREVLHKEDDGKKEDDKKDDSKKDEDKNNGDKNDESKIDEGKNNEDDSKKDSDKEDDGKNNKDDNKKDDDKKEEIKKEDDDEKFHYYPCKNNDEGNCIRHVLSTYGKCLPVYKYSYKEKIYREEAVVYLSKFNLTVTLTDSEIEGLNGKVNKFYINKKTGNLIYSVEFKSISVDSKISYFEFHRQGKEPALAADYVKVTYAPTVLTAVIPFGYYDLSLNGARITAYSGSDPVYEIGPKVTQNTDPVIQKTVTSLTADIPTAVQETFLTEAYNFFIAYVQNYVCDFGIEV